MIDTAKSTFFAKNWLSLHRRSCCRLWFVKVVSSQRDNLDKSWAAWTYLASSLLQYRRQWGRQQTVQKQTRYLPKRHLLHIVHFALITVKEESLNLLAHMYLVRAIIPRSSRWTSRIAFWGMWENGRCALHAKHEQATKRTCIRISNYRQSP